MEIQKHISRLKPFLMMGVGLITGLAWPLLHHHSVWLPGLLISALGFGDWLFPNQLAPLWRFLEKAGKIVVHYNGILLLSLVYILIITPAGLLFQWRRRLKARAHPTHSFYENPDARKTGHMRRMF